MRFKLILSLFSVLYSACNGVDVKTSSGLVRGTTISVFNKTIDQFLGIPFAEPPIGDLRFRKPKPLEKPLEGIIDATEPKYSCIQNYKDYVGHHIATNEDCLTLNIWSPVSENVTELKPVMFWIFSGGLVAGSIYLDIWNGAVMASRDVILVAANYRLGAFGFLYSGEESAPGNVGFFDQLLALKWVQENIHLFGGDKNKVTIFGISSGSWSVSAQLLSPLTKGLFKRAILQSGTIVGNKNAGDGKEAALKASKGLAKRLNCTDDNQWLDCLKKVDAHEFKQLTETVKSYVFGTEFLPLNAQQAFAQNKVHKDIDIIAGVTKDEGSTIAARVADIYKKNLTSTDLSFFISAADLLLLNHQIKNLKNMTDYYLRDINATDSEAIRWRIVDFSGDISIKCPTYLLAKWYYNQFPSDANVYFYELTHAAHKILIRKTIDIGVPHGADLPFTFGQMLLNPKNSADNINLSQQFVTMWTNFAKTGNPDPNWPQLFDTEGNRTVTLVKDLNPFDENKYFAGLFDDTCDDIWQNYFQL